MNTDNMTISGETIDYGPCAFMDAYNPATVFSSIDYQGRYAYGKQPYIGGWNLARFAETLLPLLDDEQNEAIKMATAAIGEFNKFYHENWYAGMRAKLGIFNEEEADEKLIEDLLNMIQNHSADYTNTLRALTLDKLEETALFNSEEFKLWNELWQARLRRQQESKDDSQQLMRKSNPAVIPRNHRVEEALEGAVERGDYRVMEKLLEVLSKPYAHSQEQTDFCTVSAEIDQSYRTYCGT